jgi:DNA-binding transcriptional LysR family regulator
MMKGNTLSDRFKMMKNFDLNLITTFEAVFIHRSGTKAADALGITPSAVSQALGRLREHYHDPLFVREGKALAPTTVAIGIHEGLSEAYESLVSKLQNVSFSSLPTRIIVNCSPYLSMRTLTVLRKVLNEIAPDCEIVHNINHNSINEVEDALIFRKADIIFDTHSHLSHARVSQPIYDEALTMICRTAHPRIKDKLTREQSAQENHILLGSESSTLLMLRLNIDLLHQEERICRFTTQSVLTMIAMVEATDMLAIIPQRFYEKMKNSFAVKSLEIEFTLPSQPIYMVYNKAALNNQFFAALMVRMTEHFKQDPL